MVYLNSIGGVKLKKWKSDFITELSQEIESNQVLTDNQKNVLDILLKDDRYFIPFYFDDWDYIYTEDKTELINLLMQGDWSFEINEIQLHEDIYTLY